ncbi:MAG: hypothetical protein QGH15_08895 [Kiritimatiellia bacterium]|nr:hypothetical protein [Kiritimatiellia bacterium]
MRYVRKPGVVFLSILMAVVAWAVVAQDELLPETIDGLGLAEETVPSAQNTNAIDKEIGEMDKVLNGAPEKGVSDGLEALPEALPEAVEKVDEAPAVKRPAAELSTEEALDAFLDDLADEPEVAEPKAVEAVEVEAIDLAEPAVAPEAVEVEAIDLDEPVAVPEAVEVEAIELDEPVAVPEAVEVEAIDLDEPVAVPEAVEVEAIDLDEPVAVPEAVEVEAIDLDEPGIVPEPADSVLLDDIEPLDLDSSAEPEPVTDVTESELDALLGGETPAVPATAPELPIVEPAVRLAAPAENEDIEFLIKGEALKRAATEQHIRETLVLADTSLQEGHHEDAMALYEEVLRLLRTIGDRTENMLERRAAETRLAESLYRRAMFLYERENHETALELARRSVGMGHKKALKLAAKIKDTIDEPPVVEPKKKKPRWEEDEYKVAQQSIKERLQAGREFLAAGELDDATTMFKSVLSRDPENTEAIRLLQKIGKKKYDSESAKFDATREEMLAGVRSRWTPDYYELSEEDIEIWTKWQKRTRSAPKEESDRLKIINKMKDIKIPEIDFRQANINDVIKFLQDASVEFDEVSKEGEIKGINIILNLAAGPRGVEKKKAAPDDPFATATGEAGAQGDEVPLITFSARYIDLHEALRIVTEVANLKFRVTGSVVMVVPFDAPVGDIMTRTYTVLPSVGERINEMEGALRGDDRRDSDDFIALDAVGSGPTRGDWKEFFRELGVEWPAGSSIKYIPAIGKIVVANTSDNLTVFEQVLSELNVVPNQIEIEARFVEVSQNDLESFGFEWNLTDDWEVAEKKGQENLALGDRQRISIGATTLTGGNRYADDDGAIGAETTANDAILSVASILTNPEIQMVLHMLQQSGSSDLLSAPKVTTQSGVPATLKVVTEYIYPTSFEVSGIRGNNNNNNDNQGGGGNVGAVVEPSSFETREVGVILQVTPEVSPEGQMITLEMMPEVVSDPEWFNYGSTYTDADGQIQTLNMPQPFFHSRSVQTMISIYNGATVVMGGMITESRTTIDDKIPFLGDIPIIGRLFQSQVEISDKRNLLIFVTARLVDPAGRPVKSGDQGILGEKLVKDALEAE